MESHDPDPTQPTILERLDLALAGRIAERLSAEDSLPDHIVQGAGCAPDDGERRAWIAGLLAIRGFRVGRDDVARVLAAQPGRFRPEHQEFKLVRGLAELIEELVARATAGRTVDGWWLVEGFRRVTERIERFRRNTLRLDQPWDALLRVPYPAPADLQRHIDAFHPDACFGDDPEVFAGLHPVRQGVRMMWRLARTAPFPDFNLPFAAIAFGGHLLAHGYPPLLPQAGDRVRLERLVRGPLPVRAIGVEARLLEQVTGARARA